MLKIKDNVDLKVLLKYGFKKYSLGTFQYRFNNDNMIIFIDESDLSLGFYCYNKDKKMNCDVLYDLIKDGVVEKEN